jgi:hypothetical protein
MNPLRWFRVTRPNPATWDLTQDERRAIRAGYRARFNAFATEHIIADDPFPAHSQLDQMDNNK